MLFNGNGNTSNNNNCNRSVQAGGYKDAVLNIFSEESKRCHGKNHFLKNITAVFFCPSAPNSKTTSV